MGDLVATRKRNGGTQWIYRFSNTYGASVVDTPAHTNGKPFALAVIRWPWDGLTVLGTMCGGPAEIKLALSSIKARPAPPPEQRVQAVSDQSVWDAMGATTVARQCGSCTLCCTTMGIAEIDKPERQRCPNDSGEYCRIYESRPPSCRSFTCAWIRGVGTDDDRPDKLGVVLTTYTLRGRQTLHVSEGRPGAGYQPRVKEITKLGRRARVIDHVAVVGVDGKLHLQQEGADF